MKLGFVFFASNACNFHVQLRQSASAVVAVPPCNVLCAEFESDSLIGDKNSVTGVAFGGDRSGKLAGIRATPVEITPIDCGAATLCMDVIFSFIISTGAMLKRVSLSVLFDGVASGVGMRAFFVKIYRSEIWCGQSILKLKWPVHGFDMESSGMFCAFVLIENGSF